MNKPIRRAFTRQELVSEARQWLRENYALTKSTNPDRYFERLGFLIDFVTDLIPDEKEESK